MTFLTYSSPTLFLTKEVLTNFILMKTSPAGHLFWFPLRLMGPEVTIGLFLKLLSTLFNSLEIKGSQGGTKVTTIFSVGSRAL